MRRKVAEEEGEEEGRKRMIGNGGEEGESREGEHDLIRDSRKFTRTSGWVGKTV